MHRARIILSLAALLLAALLLDAAAFGQPAPRAFEAATIKPAAPATGGGRAASSGDRITLNNTTLLNALARAFAVTSANQIAGPSWIVENRYDIVAKAPGNTSPEEVRGMLQALLIERFQLALHHETRDLPAYDLVLGKGTLKLTPDDSREKTSTVVSEGRREMKSTSMASLAQLAALTLRLPVVDQTGLSGYYDFPYEPSQEETQRDTAPSIFTVFADLGLKLESKKAPLDVVVIDSGNKTPIGD